MRSFVGLRASGLRSLLVVASAAVTSCVTSCAPSGALRITKASAQGQVESSRGRGDLGGLRLRPEVCRGVELAPAYEPTTERALLEFLGAQGLETSIERARGDLVYVDVRGAGTEQPVRLRVAVLGDSGSAGNELHRAILEHGPGAWGVHRANLAVLAPVAASVDDALAFAIRTKLACWGVLTIAGRDDTFVVPGGYFEL
jgi:hypothetical protein